MKLGFEDTGQASYDSGSQSARVITEAWAFANAFCPNCGSERLSKFPNSRPVADFYCGTCDEEFELKSTKAKIGNKLVDGAYQTMRDRLMSDKCSNLFILKYSLKYQSVESLFIIPKQFFVPEVIEQRRPLSAEAKRAGWVGCNILIGQIPELGKIHIVKNGIVRDKLPVLLQWKESLFLRDSGRESRGWLLNVLKCVEDIGKAEFTLDEVYAFEYRLKKIYPDNSHVREKIRQQLQVLRDKGRVAFLGRGRYRYAWKD